MTRNCFPGNKLKWQILFIWCAPHMYILTLATHSALSLSLFHSFSLTFFSLVTNYTLMAFCRCLRSHSFQNAPTNLPNDDRTAHKLATQLIHCERIKKEEGKIKYVNISIKTINFCSNDPNILKQFNKKSPRITYYCIHTWTVCCSCKEINFINFRCSGSDKCRLSSRSNWEYLTVPKMKNDSFEKAKSPSSNLSSIYICRSTVSRGLELIFIFGFKR